MEKNEIIKLPLHEILKNNGWWIKKDKSTATSKTLTNDYDDLVVVSKLKNDDYVYLSFNSRTHEGAEDIIYGIFNNEQYTKKGSLFKSFFDTY